MATPEGNVSLEEQIGQWRSYLLRRQAIHSVDVAEMEDHLREQVAALIQAGLSSDEAFLVGVKRMGAQDALSREFAREHSDRLWKQLVVLPADPGEQGGWARSAAFCTSAREEEAPQRSPGFRLTLCSSFRRSSRMLVR